MEEPEKPTIIVIKRIKKIKKSAHHGGSWKIAYADFVTAMMAFFLLMWLLSLLNKSQIRSISEYFKHPNKTGLVDQGSRVNKDLQHDNFIESGKEKEKWKDKSPQEAKDRIKIDEKTPQTSQGTESKQSLDKKTQNISDAMQKLQAMKNDLENKLEKDPELRQYKNQLNFIVTADGLKIELRDLENKPMFTRGKTDFQKYAQSILSWLGKELNAYPNQVVIIGHTDTVPFQSSQYSNWELSSDRANATRRTLIKFGMDKDKILRVIGMGDKDLLDKSNGLNPSNRRIEIIVLTDEAVAKMRK